MDGKKAAEKLVEALQLEANEYRVGTSKVCEEFSSVNWTVEYTKDNVLSAV